MHITYATTVFATVTWMGVSKHWTGFSTGTWDWNVGLDYRTGMWDWNMGLD